MHRFLLGLRVLLALALALPAPLAAANAPASLLCNPSGQPLSLEAQARIDALETYLGLADDGGDETAPPHCEDCLPPFVGLESASVEADRPRVAPVPASVADMRAEHPSQRGPPLGSRAPPSFRSID